MVEIVTDLERTTTLKVLPARPTTPNMIISTERKTENWAGHVSRDWEAANTDLLIALVLRGALEQGGVIAAILVWGEERERQLLQTSELQLKATATVARAEVLLTLSRTICRLVTGWQVVWFRTEQSDRQLESDISLSTWNIIPLLVRTGWTVGRLPGLRSHYRGDWRLNDQIGNMLINISLNILKCWAILEGRDSMVTCGYKNNPIYDENLNTDLSHSCLFWL